MDTAGHTWSFLWSLTEQRNSDPHDAHSVGRITGSIWRCPHSLQRCKSCWIRGNDRHGRTASSTRWNICRNVRTETAYPTKLPHRFWKSREWRLAITWKGTKKKKEDTFSNAVHHREILFLAWKNFWPHQGRPGLSPCEPFVRDWKAYGKSGTSSGNRWREQRE